MEPYTFTRLAFTLQACFPSKDTSMETFFFLEREHQMWGQAFDISMVDSEHTSFYNLQNCSSWPGCNPFPWGFTPCVSFKFWLTAVVFLCASLLTYVILIWAFKSFYNVRHHSVFQGLLHATSGFCVPEAWTHRLSHFNIYLQFLVPFSRNPWRQTRKGPALKQIAWRAGVRLEYSVFEVSEDMWLAFADGTVDNGIQTEVCKILVPSACCLILGIPASVSMWGSPEQSAADDTYMAHLLHFSAANQPALDAESPSWTEADPRCVIKPGWNQ